MNRCVYSWLSLLAALAFLGCGDDSGASEGDAAADAGDGGAVDSVADGPPPETIAFETGALSLRVTVEPFGWVLRSAAGDVLIETLGTPLEVPGDGAENAYGPPAVTFNAPTYRERVHWGWDTYEGTDQPWMRFDRTLETRQTENGVVLVLAPRDDPARLEVELIATDNRVEVRMTIDEDASDRFNRIGQSFRLPPEEAFFGLGGRVTTVNHLGHSYYGYVEESGLGLGENQVPGPANPGPNGPSMTPFPIPFVLSTAGYGLWLDTDARSAFHLGSHTPDAWRLEAAESAISFTIYANRDPLRSLSDFTGDTGRPTLPPQWALGPRRRLDPDAQVDGVPEWQALREQGVPTTIIEDTRRLLPDGTTVGDEAQLSADLRQLEQWGYRTIGYAAPYVSADAETLSDTYADGSAAGYYATTSAGDDYLVSVFAGVNQRVALIDVTEAAALSWFGGLLRGGLDLGYSGFRLDFGEYTPFDAQFHDGRRGVALRNSYPLLAQRAAWEVLVDERPDSPLLIARSGYTGGAASMTMAWLTEANASFDPTDGLPSVVRATINLAMSGYPMVGADIGGTQSFNDPAPDREVYLRWAAFAALSPAMHDENAGLGGSDLSERWTIWRDSFTRVTYARLALLHTRLAPYRHALARQSAEAGWPLVRHPFLMFPDDPQVLTLDDQYFLGPSLLVAPVVQRGVSARSVYFPAGRYVHWESGEVYEGPTRTRVETPLDGLPLFIADGGLVPLLDRSIETLVAEESPDVVGPGDVVEWLDVRAVRSPGRSELVLADGTVLAVEVTGDVEPPFVANNESELPFAITVEQTSECDGCYLWRDDTDPPTLWITTPLGENLVVEGEGIRLEVVNPATRPRRVRWEVLLLPPI